MDEIHVSIYNLSAFGIIYGFSYLTGFDMYDLAFSMLISLEAYSGEVGR